MRSAFDLDERGFVSAAFVEQLGVRAQGAPTPSAAKNSANTGARAFIDTLWL